MPIKIASVRKYKFFVPVVLWTIIIFVLSTGHPPPINNPIKWLSIDKVGHLIFYLVEVLLLIWAIAKSYQWKQHHNSIIAVCVIVATSYGTFLEFVQANLPHRSFDYADMTANAAGALLGMLIYYSIAKQYFLDV